MLQTEHLCPPQVNMLNSNTQCDITGGAFGRRLGHEDTAALMSGISALLKETPESFLAASVM